MKPQKNREVEIKLRVGELPDLRRRLRQLGARKVRRVHEWNALYDTPEESLSRSGQLLRLRIEAPSRSWVSRRDAARRPGAALLTYKRPAGGNSRYKVREEVEVRVGDPERLGTILKALGLRLRFRYEKLRTSYRLPGFPGLNVELDETPIGLFLELEGPEREIDRAARLLDRGPGDYVTANYLVLYLDHCQRRGLTSRDMFFRGRKK